MRYTYGMARKTSVYLTDEVEERVKASGLGLPELIRRGLAGGEPEALESVVVRSVRAALEEYCADRREARAVATPARAAGEEKALGSPATAGLQEAPGVAFIAPPACRHPAALIQEDGTCGACGEEAGP